MSTTSLKILKLVGLRITSHFNTGKRNFLLFQLPFVFSISNILDIDQSKLNCRSSCKCTRQYIGVLIPQMLNLSSIHLAATSHRPVISLFKNLSAITPSVKVVLI